MTSELLISIIIVVVLIILVAFILRWFLNKSEYDGELKIVGYDEDTGIPDLQLMIKTDPMTLSKKRKIVLKMIDETK